MLATVIRRYWHALVRDVLALGYRASDLFTTLSFHEVLCIVLGAHPQTSVRFFLDAGWSREAHLLANMNEQQAGVARVHEPYERPGLDQRIQDPMSTKFFQADAMTWTEMDEMERKRYSDDAPKVGTNRVRAIKARGQQ
jgi:hypothetical protein